MKGPREGPCDSRYQYLTLSNPPLVVILVLSIPKVLPSPHEVNELSWLSKANCHPILVDAVHQGHKKLIYALAEGPSRPFYGSMNYY